MVLAWLQDLLQAPGVLLQALALNLEESSTCSLLGLILSQLLFAGALCFPNCKYSFPSCSLPLCPEVSLDSFLLPFSCPLCFKIIIHEKSWVKDSSNILPNTLSHGSVLGNLREAL